MSSLSQGSIFLLGGLDFSIEVLGSLGNRDVLRVPCGSTEHLLGVLDGSWVDLIGRQTGGWDRSRFIVGNRVA